MDERKPLKQVSFLDLSSFLQTKKVTMKEYALCDSIQHHYYMADKLIALLIYTNETRQFTAYITEDTL
jgi:hypothetical protein